MDCAVFVLRNGDKLDSISFSSFSIVTIKHGLYYCLYNKTLFADSPSLNPWPKSTCCCSVFYQLKVVGGGGGVATACWRFLAVYAVSDHSRKRTLSDTSHKFAGLH